MKDETLKRLEVYFNKVKDALGSPTPMGHINHIKQYKDYLSKELEDTKRKIENLKLGDK